MINIMYIIWNEYKIWSKWELKRYWVLDLNLSVIECQVLVSRSILFFQPYFYCIYVSINFVINLFYTNKIRMFLEFVARLFEMYGCRDSFWVVTISIFSMAVQSDVERFFCFSYVLYITKDAFHQINHKVAFTV